MSNTVADIKEQLAARRWRDHAARKVAEGAILWMDLPEYSFDRLTAGIEEYRIAKARAPHHLTIKVGRLIITGTDQASGAPLIDTCTTMVHTIPDDGTALPSDHPPGHPVRTDGAAGYAIRLPGRTALVVAWVGARRPFSYTEWRRIRERRRHPHAHPRVGGMEDRSAAAFAAMAANGTLTHDGRTR